MLMLLVPEQQPRQRYGQVIAQGWPSGWGQGTISLLQGSNETGRKIKILWVQMGIFCVHESQETAVPELGLLRLSYIPRFCQCRPRWDCRWWHSEKEWQLLRELRHILTHFHNGKRRRMQWMYLKVLNFVGTHQL